MDRAKVKEQFNADSLGFSRKTRRNAIQQNTHKLSTTTLDDANAAPWISHLAFQSAALGIAQAGIAEVQAISGERN